MKALDCQPLRSGRSTERTPAPPTETWYWAKGTHGFHTQVEVPDPPLVAMGKPVRPREIEYTSIPGRDLDFTRSWGSSTVGTRLDPVRVDQVWG